MQLFFTGGAARANTTVCHHHCVFEKKHIPFGNTPLFGVLVQIELSRQCISSLLCLMKENLKEKHAFLMQTSFLSADAYRALWGVNADLCRGCKG